MRRTQTWKKGEREKSEALGWAKAHTSKGKKRERENEKSREADPTGEKRKRVREGENKGEAGPRSWVVIGPFGQQSKGKAGSGKKRKAGQARLGHKAHKTQTGCGLRLDNGPCWLGGPCHTRASLISSFLFSFSWLELGHQALHMLEV